MSRQRIAIFQPIFAHYRAALLRELEQNGTFDYSFCADVEDYVDRIPALDLSGNPSFVRTRCRRLLGQITWQSQVVATALGNRHQILIFPGNAAWLSTWFGAAIARIRGRRVLFWTHGWTRQDRGLKKYVRILFYRLANGLLLYGERARQIALDSGFDAARVHVIYNSLDFDHQQQLLGTLGKGDGARVRHELFANAQTPCVIAVARLTVRKRFDLLIDAMARLNRQGQAANLIVVGDGPERDRLQALAASANVTTAFVGACYDETRIAQLFACATVCVSPGNVGLTCMHSLGYGTPVITHRDAADQMPEWEAIVAGVNGDLFERDNAEDLARVLARWLGEQAQRATREECRRMLATRYHPAVQRRLIEAAAAGEPPHLSAQDRTAAVNAS